MSSPTCGQHLAKGGCAGHHITNYAPKAKTTPNDTSKRPSPKSCIVLIFPTCTASFFEYSTVFIKVIIVECFHDVLTYELYETYLVRFHVIAACHVW